MNNREKRPEGGAKKPHASAQYSPGELPDGEQPGKKQRRMDPKGTSTQQGGRTAKGQPRPGKEDRNPGAARPLDQGENQHQKKQPFPGKSHGGPASGEEGKPRRAPLEPKAAKGAENSAVRSPAAEPGGSIWKKWGSQVKESGPVRSLRQRMEQAARRDDQPDEMEQIYGTRSILPPVSTGEEPKEELSPQFGYLFGQGEDDPEDGDPLSLFRLRKEPAAEESKHRQGSPDMPGGEENFRKEPQTAGRHGVKATDDVPENDRERLPDWRKAPGGKEPPKGRAVPGDKTEELSADRIKEELLLRRKAERHLKEKKGTDDPERDQGDGLRPRGEEKPTPGQDGKSSEEVEKSNLTVAENRRTEETAQEEKRVEEPHGSRPDSPHKGGEKDAEAETKGHDAISSKLPLGDSPAAKKGKPLTISEEAPQKTEPGAAASRYEKLFGKPQPAKPAQAKSAGQKSGASKKKKAGDEPGQLFSPKTSKHSILLEPEELKEALQDEYEEYRRAQKEDPELTEPAPVKKHGKKEPKPEPRERNQQKKEKFSIFGEVEPEDGTPAAPSKRELPALDDYTHPDDAFSVKAELIDHMRTVIIRTVVTAAAALLSIGVTLLYYLDLPFLEGLKGSPYWYLTANLVLLLITAGFCYVPMGGGMKALFRMKGNSDSAIAFAAWAAILHGAAAMFAPGAYLSGELSLYGSLVALGLFLNSWGKLLMVRRVYANFKYVSSPERKYAVRIVSDEKSADKLCQGMGLEKSIVAYQRPVGFLSNFLRLSYEPDPSEKLAGKLAPVGAIASIIVGSGAFLMTQDLQSALAALSISACISVPMCCVPAVNLPMRGVCKRALRMGAMLVGYPGVRQFADTNAVVLEASQLFPGKSVVLHGIKGFGGERIDQAILEAGAVMTKAKAPMAATFHEIIQGKGELLPKVDSVTYEDEMGVVGWVGGRRVLVGNRKLLEEHGVTPPERSFEEQYQQNGRQLTYLATAGELKAMFVTSYIPDEKMMAQMQRLEAQGVCFLIRTSDPNVTARMVSDHFQVYYRSIRVLPEQLAEAFDEEPGQAEKETARAYLSTKGRPAVMQRALISCIRMRNKVTLSLLLQSMAVVLGFLLVAFLIFASGLGQLGAVEMLIYSVFWVLAVMIVPSIRRP